MWVIWRVVGVEEEGEREVVGVYWIWMMLVFVKHR